MVCETPGAVLLMTPVPPVPAPEEFDWRPILYGVRLVHVTEKPPVFDASAVVDAWLPKSRVVLVPVTAQLAVMAIFTSIEPVAVLCARPGTVTDRPAIAAQHIAKYLIFMILHLQI